MKAIYAGSFDPITNGHLWLIEQASWLFPEELVIAIAVNDRKKYTYSIEQREAMVQAALNPDEYQTVAGGLVTVKVIGDGYLVDHVNELYSDPNNKLHCKCIVRGIRNVNDYQYEQQMCAVNQHADPFMTSVFLMPPPNLCHVSSSMVKSLMAVSNWRERGLVKEYVPPAVYDLLVKYGD